jgi:hypothetical protein
MTAQVLSPAPTFEMPDTESAMRGPLLNLLAIGLLASGAIAGCKRQPAVPADTAVSTPPATTAPPVVPARSAIPASIAVNTIELGNAIDAEGHVATPMIRFAAADTIHASVATDGPAGTLTAKWLLGRTTVTHTRIVGAGPQVTQFEVSEPAGLPSGRHTLQVLVGGNVVQTRDFEVR